MSDDTPDSILSIAANIIGLITFVLSALNLLIVRILQRERLTFDDFDAMTVRDSVRLLQLKISYIRTARTFRTSDAPGRYFVSSETDEGSQELASNPLDGMSRDVKECINKASEVLKEYQRSADTVICHPSLSRYIQDTIALLRQWDFKGWYVMSAKEWRRFWERKQMTKKQILERHNRCEFRKDLANTPSGPGSCTHLSEPITPRS